MIFISQTMFKRQRVSPPNARIRTLMGLIVKIFTEFVCKNRLNKFGAKPCATIVQKIIKSKLVFEARHSMVFNRQVKLADLALNLLVNLLNNTFLL